MPSWQSTSRIGCPIDNPARRSRGAAPSTRPQWTRVPLDSRPRWRYVVDKAGAANAAPALKYKFYFTPHFGGYTEFGIVPENQIKEPGVLGADFDRRAGDRAGVQRPYRCGYDHLGGRVADHQGYGGKSVLPVPHSLQRVVGAERPDHQRFDRLGSSQVVQCSVGEVTT